METFSFTLIEVLALIGLFQCLLIIIYFMARAGSYSRAMAPLMLYLVLAGAFYLDFGSVFLHEGPEILKLSRFWLWTSIAPLGILFILQFSDFSKPLPFSYYLLVLIVPLFAGLSSLIPLTLEESGYCLDSVAAKGEQGCEPYNVWRILLGFLAGTLCLPFFWLRTHLLSDIWKQPSGKERFWTILSLLGLIIVLLILDFLLLTEQAVPAHYEFARTLLGLLFVYVSATCLFRIYPIPAVEITRSKTAAYTLQEEDYRILKELEDKIKLEKVYLEPSFSRSDLARELQISESHLSKLVKHAYDKSLPMVLNEFRVREACQLLKETDAPIQVIAGEVGFNSLASFNRVFKEITGKTASHVREHTQSVKTS